MLNSKLTVINPKVLTGFSLRLEIISFSNAILIKLVQIIMLEFRELCWVTENDNVDELKGIRRYASKFYLYLLKQCVLKI